MDKIVEWRCNVCGEQFVDYGESRCFFCDSTDITEVVDDADAAYEVLGNALLNYALNGNELEEDEE